MSRIIVCAQILNILMDLHAKVVTQQNVYLVYHLELHVLVVLLQRFIVVEIVYAGQANMMIVGLVQIVQTSVLLVVQLKYVLIV